MDKKWQIICYDCQELKPEEGAIWLGEHGYNSSYRCKDCAQKLEEGLKDLGIL